MGGHIGLTRAASCDFLHGPVLAQAFSRVVEEFFGGNFWQWHENVTWTSIEPALRRVLDHVEAEGPYDGLFGFSQGASIVTLLSRLAVRRALGRDTPCPWRFVICAC